MKKSLLTLLVLLTFVLVIAPAVPAVGSTNYVWDETGILTQAQVDSLNKKADELSKERECGVYIWMVDLVPEEYAKTIDDTEAYVKAFYESHSLGYGDDKNGMIPMLETGDIPG